MPDMMTGEERRKCILNLISHADAPMSGSKIGKETGVSRQVVVQDIALLRSQGHAIVATTRGYLVEGKNKVVRLFKIHHTDSQTKDELMTIVDLGGCVLDVIVNHRIYGKMSANLNIKNRREIMLFVKDLESGKSSPLKNITSGYHFHHISADNEETLDEIEAALKEKGFLCELLPYEVF